MRQAKTEEEIIKVREYLSSKGTVAGNGQLFYSENEEGDVIGAYSMEVKLCIDPLQAESPVIAIQLMADGLAMARGHTDRVYTLTGKDKVKRVLENNYGAKLWTKDVDEYVINLDNKSSDGDIKT